MVSDTVPRAQFVPSAAASIPARTSDQEFCRLAMRDGIERLDLSLEELLRRVTPDKAVA